MRRVAIGLLVLLLALGARAEELGKSGFVDSGGVKIHHVTQGKGPLCVLLHGFPDFHYSWKRQMPVLAKHFQVVAIDLRGYNRSDQPKGVPAYAMDKLVGDVAAVLKHFKRDKAVIVGHDWGGAIAWAFAMAHPEKTERLVVLNCPHPRGILRELVHNPEQRKYMAYARAFQQEGAEKLVPLAILTSWVKDPADRKLYTEAMKRSSLAGMLAYYKANYPKPPYKEEGKFPQVKCPVLILHGLDDPYLLPGALNDTWKWIDNEVTIVTIPRAGHWVHHDAPERVNGHLVRWLTSK